MSSTTASADGMSDYEKARWEELQAHWEKKRERRQLVPERARAVMSSSASAVKGAAGRAGRAAANKTPQKVKDVAGNAADSALVPTVRNVVQMLELLNDWVVELSDPDTVLAFHREKGREVSTLADLRSLPLEDLEELTSKMTLRWRTIGAGQGASFGALAMIPVPVVSSAAAIGLDMIAMQVLTTAVATRVCYSYGFDAADPQMKHVIDRMVARAYRDQVAKVGSVHEAGAAFAAAKGRVNWGKKLRNDHHLLEAVEKLLKHANGGRHVPVKNARMGMPAVAVLAGAATNSHILGDTVKQARNYGATLILTEKYGLPMPSALDSSTPAMVAADASTDPPAEPLSGDDDS